MLAANPSAWTSAVVISGFSLSQKKRQRGADPLVALELHSQCMRAGVGKIADGGSLWFYRYGGSNTPRNKNCSYCQTWMESKSTNRHSLVAQSIRPGRTRIGKSIDLSLDLTGAQDKIAWSPPSAPYPRVLPVSQGPPAAARSRHLKSAEERAVTDSTC